MKNVNINNVPRMLKVLAYAAGIKGREKEREWLKKRAFRTHLPLPLLPQNPQEIKWKQQKKYDYLVMTEKFLFQC